MHVLLIRNRHAGSADQVDPARVLVDRGCTVTDADISDALRWERSQATSLSSIERVVVAGGDGSIGCAASLALKLDVPLGVVPAGTANDFARVMELPTELEQACILAVTGDGLRDVDVAYIDGRPFMNVASIGIAPEAAEHARPLKRGLRALAYPVGAAIAAVRTRPVWVAATVDGMPVWSGPSWQVMIANSGAFGGWADTGRARQGDGALDLVIVPAGRGTRELTRDAAALMSGELADRDGVFHVRGSTIEVTLRRALRIVVDGELVDVGDRHVRATVAPRPARLVSS